MARGAVHSAPQRRGGVGPRFNVLDSTFSSSGRSLFFNGLVVGFANPEAIVFLAVLFPHFIEPDGAPASVQMLFLGLIFVAIAFVFDSAWGVAAGWPVSGSCSVAFDFARWLAGLSTAGGVLMIAFGVRLAFIVNSG